MMLNSANMPVGRPNSIRDCGLCRPRKMHTYGSKSVSSEYHETAAIVRRNRWLPWACAVVAVLAVGTAIPAAAQTPLTSYVEPPAQSPAKPMSPARNAWMKVRCSQLVAFFDRYGASSISHSDGVRNHTRIGAVIECERTHFQTGIKTMEALLKRKAFDVPKSGTPEVEPEDVAASDVPRSVSQRY